MIRVGLVQDDDADNELDQCLALHELRRETGREFDLVWSGGERDLAAIPEVDILLVDYGGLHHAYGDVVERWGRSVRRWADDHSGRPVVLWTAFTRACYQAIFEDFDPNADNMFARYRGAWDFDGERDFWSRLKEWLPKEEPQIEGWVDAAGAPVTDRPEFEF